MEMSDQTHPAEERFVNQLHCLSELGETLAVRLIQLEERVLALEERQALKKVATKSDAQKLLRNSESKIMHLHNLLDIQTRSKENIDESNSSSGLNDMDLADNHEDITDSTFIDDFYDATSSAKDSIPSSEESLDFKDLDNPNYIENIDETRIGFQSG